MSVSLKEGVKMKQLKKQWNKVTALLLTFGMVFWIICGSAGTGGGWKCVRKYNF